MTTLAEDIKLRESVSTSATLDVEEYDDDLRVL